MAITTSDVFTSLSSTYPYSFAQVKQNVVMVNGHDNNKVYDLIHDAGTDLGITAPAGGPFTLTAGVGENPRAGTYRYRIKWKDSNTGAISLASSEVTITTTTVKKVTVDKSAMTAPDARVTHWIIERTTDNGKVFFPVNVTNSAPNGTVIATDTFDDTVSDSTLRQRTIIRNVGGKPSPYGFCFSHNNRLWLVGGRTHYTQLDVTNGSPTVTNNSLNTFNSNMVGQYITVPPTIGTTTTYLVSAVGGVNSLTLSTNFAGSTTTTYGFVFGPRNKIAWSESGEPEHFGVQNPDGLDNELFIGARGSVLHSGCGIGARGVLFAGTSELYVLDYRNDPNPFKGDGAVVQVPTTRGVVSPRCLKYFNGKVYGLDTYGMWSMTPDGVPEHISSPLDNDFRRGAFDFRQWESFHVGIDPLTNIINFWMVETTTTGAYVAYQYDTVRQKWVGTFRLPFAAISSGELKTYRGISRYAFTTASGTGYNSKMYSVGAGWGGGVDPAVVTPVATITGVSGTTTLTCSGATFNAISTVNGVPCRVVFASTGLTEDFIASSNTSTTVVTSHTFSTAPVSGDTLYVGVVDSKIRTGRLNAGLPDRKKKWLSVQVPLKYKTSCVPFKMKVYLDDKAQPDTDRTLGYTEDGLTVVASTATVTCDPTTNHTVYEFPLNGVWRYAIALEFISDQPGVPWETLGPIKVYYEVDSSEQPRKR